MPALDVLKGLDTAGATLTLWVFRKYASAGQPPRYVGRWVGTTDELDRALKDAVTAERDRIEEVQQYGLLSQNNESSALSIGTIETHAGLIVDQAAGETPQKKANHLKRIQNSDFYVIKIVAGDTVIHAVRKTDASWRTKRALNAISVFFSDHQLDLDNGLASTSPDTSTSSSSAKISLYQVKLVSSQSYSISKPTRKIS